MPEVSLGCGLNSVGSTPEVNGVEIVADDLVFGLFSVDLEGKNCFLGLAHIAGCFPNVVALNILLGQGRCTLACPTPNIVDQCASNTFKINTRIRVESPVFRGNNSMRNIVRKSRCIDDLPIDLRHPAHFGGAIGVVDSCGLRESNLISLGNRQRGIGNQEGPQPRDDQPKESKEDSAADTCAQTPLLLPLICLSALSRALLCTRAACCCRGLAIALWACRTPTRTTCRRGASALGACASTLAAASCARRGPA